jgi:hypothetical protein
MSRSTQALLASLVLGSALVAAPACSKSAGNQETGATQVTGAPGAGAQGAMEKVMVPGATTPPPSFPSANGAAGPAEGTTAGQADEDPFRLKPEEGQLAIEAPAPTAPGTEVTARIVVTPAGPYKINKEFPTKLTLEGPEGVAIAKAQLTAGGADQSKGDADAFEDKQLAFTVKLTPSQAGNHTVNGTFRFAVCDKDTCLSKKEQIQIAVATN